MGKQIIFTLVTLSLTNSYVKCVLTLFKPLITIGCTVTLPVPWMIWPSEQQQLTALDSSKENKYVDRVTVNIWPILGGAVSQWPNTSLL